MLDFCEEVAVAEIEHVFAIVCEKCRTVLAKGIITQEEVERIRKKHGWQSGTEWSLCPKCQAAEDRW